MTSTVQALPQVTDSDIAIFSLLFPISRESHHVHALLAQSAQQDTLPPGKTLARMEDHDPWALYLLDGTVELQASDGQRHQLNADPKHPMGPIAQLKPRKYQVTTVTQCQVLRLPDSLIEQVLERYGEDCDHLSLERRANPRQALLHRILRDLEADTLRLPSLPEVALRVRRAIDEEQADARRVEQIIESAPVIAAKLIRTANSAFYLGAEPINDCATAIVRLGMETTKQMVLSLSLQELFDGQSPALHQRMMQLWSHSVDVASLAFVLARHLGGFPPETALLAGLLHDIGEVPILGYVEEWPELARDTAQLETAITTLRGRVGAALLQHWNFSEELVTAAREAEEWFRDPGPTPDLTDLILVAKLHSRVGTPQRSIVPAMIETPAFQKLEAGTLSPKASLTILDEARERVAEARGLLIGR